MAPLLPSHISPQKVQRIVLTEVQKNPAIMKCSKGSILQSVMEACSMGLVPNSIEGLAYLVPYGNKCQLQPGYKGLMKLAMQSGHLQRFGASLFTTPIIISRSLKGLTIPALNTSRILMMRIPAN